MNFQVKTKGSPPDKEWLVYLDGKLQNSFFTQKEAMKWMEQQVEKQAEHDKNKQEFKRKNILGVFKHDG